MNFITLASVSFFFLLVSPVLGGDEMISKSEFTQRFVDALRQRGKHIEVEVAAELEVRVVHHDTLKNSCFLDNAYAAYCADSDHGEAVLERYVEAAISTLGLASGRAALDLTRIFPVIRDSIFVREYGELTKTTPYTEKLNAQLSVLYVLDDSITMRYLTNQQVDTVLELFDLRALSVNNLRRTILPKTEGYDLGNTLFVFIAGGDYESSLLLLDEIWTKQNFAIHGDFVVAIPSRDILLATGSEDPAGIEALKEKLEELKGISLDHLISWNPFVKRDSTWILYDPESQNK